MSDELRYNFKSCPYFLDLFFFVWSVHCTLLIESVHTNRLQNIQEIYVYERLNAWKKNIISNECRAWNSWRWLASGRKARKLCSLREGWANLYRILQNTGEELKTSSSLSNWLYSWENKYCYENGREASVYNNSRWEHCKCKGYIVKILAVSVS